MLQKNRQLKLVLNIGSLPFFMMTMMTMTRKLHDESLSDKDVPKENFKIYLNPLFDEEIISTKIDPHHFNAEFELIEYLLNRDTLIVSSPKFDSLLEEFSGELAHIDLISPEIDEADFNPEEEIRLVEKLLYDNSSPRPPKKLNSENSKAVIESFSPSPIPIKDSDSLMEEIDIFLALDDSIPPGIENDDYDSEGDIIFLEELLSNDSLSLPENESFHFDRYYDPSSPRPPCEDAPDAEEFNFVNIKPDTGILTAKLVDVISEYYVLMPSNGYSLKDKNKAKTDNRAREWKERENSKPKMCAS
ncbi:hypothetical protein Tco_1371269 [Tanacetum coccineum]